MQDCASTQRDREAYRVETNNLSGSTSCNATSTTKQATPTAVETSIEVRPRADHHEVRVGRADGTIVADARELTVAEVAQLAQGGGR